MKNKASVFVKNIMSVISSMVKGKITGVKSKAQAMRIRLLVFSLLKSKKLSLGAISNKIQALLDRKDSEETDADEDQSKAIILYDARSTANDSPHLSCVADEASQAEREAIYYHQYIDDDDKYPDLTHSLFDEEDGMEGLDQGGSIIDLVKNSKENEGQDFKLEDQIDHVADLFIKRFRRQMRLQKLESFKRLQEMIGRGA